MTGPQDHRLEVARRDELLALLLRAPIGRLDRQARVLGEHLTPAIARDDRRGEDQAPDARSLASLDQASRSVDVDLVDLRRVALGGDLGGEVDHALGFSLAQDPLEGRGIGKIALGRGRAGWLGPRAPHE